jgi:hypothetical protein
MDGERDNQGQPGKNPIKIPSYQEVFGSGASSSPAPPSYNPPLASSCAAASSSSSSFSQSFSFLKSTEFYTPPPPPPQPAVNPRYFPLSTAFFSNFLRRRPAPEFMLWCRPPQASPSAQVSQSKNTILVSHRQVLNRDYLSGDAYPHLLRQILSLFVCLAEREPAAEAHQECEVGIRRYYSRLRNRAIIMCPVHKVLTASILLCHRCKHYESTTVLV